LHCFFYFEAKNKTALILPKAVIDSTKKPHKGAFLGEKLIWQHITAESLYP
jgi:hypothetical protein